MLSARAPGGPERLHLGMGSRPRPLRTVCDGLEAAPTGSQEFEHLVRVRSCLPYSDWVGSTHTVGNERRLGPLQNGAVIGAIGYRQGSAGLYEMATVSVCLLHRAGWLWWAQ